MKKGSIHINTAAHGPKGSALILVVVLTVLLAAVGVLFLMTSRIDEMATSGIVRTRELRAGVNVVLDRIRTVLTDDLFGGDDFLLDGSGTDEYWDYPGDDDPWLASLEPEVFNDRGTPGDPTDDIFYWRHITDLYGHIFAISGYKEVDDPSYPVSSGVVTQITADNEPVGDVVDDPDNPTVIWPWGTRADADGDGVADSRWIALPGITSSGGENIYAAIRIIDNCGMININTAYRDPTGVLPWDGSLLTHIDLNGIKAVGDFGIPVETFHLVRCNNFPIVDDVYHDQVARRLLNPIIGYLPFDIGDELEFRNRFFLSTYAVARSELVWPVTFDPPTGAVGRRIPYTFTAELPAWFLKATSPETFYTDSVYNGICNRRHLSTTYSFDRVITPWADTSNMPALRDAWYNWTDWDQNPDQWSYRPVSVNDPDPNLIAAAIWLGLPNGFVIRNNMPQFTGLGWTDSEIRERLACQMAVNLADFIDRDSPETVTSFTSNGVTYYGHETTAQQLYISMIAVAQYDSDINNDPCNEETHYAIELYNPGPRAIDNLSENWSLEIYNNADVLIETINLPGGTVDAARSYIITDSYDPEGFSNSDADEPVANLTFSDNYRLVLKQNTRVYDVITDIGSIPDHSQNSAGLEKYTAYRGKWRLHEVASTSLPIWGSTPVWDPCSVGSLSKFNTVALETDPCYPIQTTVADNSLRTLGEFTNVLALGTMDVGGTVYTMPQFWENIRTSAGGDIVDITAGRVGP